MMAIFNSPLGCVMNRLTGRILGCHHGDSGFLQLPSDGAGNEALPALFFHPEVAISLFWGQGIQVASAMSEEC